MKKKFLFFTSLLLLSSCVIEEKFIFNKDFSGSYTFIYNFEDVLKTLSEMDSSANTSEAPEINIEELNNIPGLSNAKIDYDPKGIIIFTTDFNKPENIDNLWQSQLSGLDSLVEDLYFLKEKRFIAQNKSYDFNVNFYNPKTTSDESIFDGTYQYKLQIVAPKKISSKSNPEKSVITLKKNKMEMQIESEDFTEDGKLKLQLK